MKTVNKKSLLFIFCSFFVSAFGSTDLEDEGREFINSFINYYDFSTVGRYTHEYHPFLFEKSSYSLDELEKSIVVGGLPIKGRIVLTGYEEQAIPAYFTNYKVCTGSKINDEAWSKGKSGWTQQLHNKFGVMTGFLFRNVGAINQIQKTSFHEKKFKEPLFEHINLHVMPVYNNRSYIFQRHAFGGMLPIMQAMQDVVEYNVFQRNSKLLFDSLVEFWNKLYEYELRFGNRKVLGTQDILFSVAHAQHLFRSNVPLFKYYIGPDITYPIKVTRLQKEAATYNSQTFVKKFVKNLKPINQKSTVYIFCSFVDGVGKSTLLGNVQNYKKYGTNFADYDPVDNSSSQLAQMYKYDDKVFIADLPAQMSHFTYKPDGMVYFDVLACGMSDDRILQISKFVQDNKDKFTKNYEAFLDEIKKEIEDVGLKKVMQKEWKKENAFVKNLFLLKKTDANLWVPFIYNSEYYLFNRNNPSRIRKLVRLDLADSIGLKNYEAEQMLFLDGVRFPLPYKVFVDDLIDQIKSRGIEQVVFVNFLSMYPRSSRENIRVNYLLQQLSLLYDDFCLNKSLYDSYVSDAHLLYKLKKDIFGDILSAFQKEVLVRLSLYNVMSDAKLRTVEGIPLDSVTKLIKEQLKNISEKSITSIENLTKTKLNKEKKSLKAIHGRTKDFINVQELDFDDVIKFCEKMQEKFSYYVDNDRINDLWQETGDVLGIYGGHQTALDKVIRLSDGKWAELLFVVSRDCKDESVLAPIVHTIRASWYAALGNLVGGKSPTGSKSIELKAERFRIPPIFVKKTEDDKIAVFRQEFELVDQLYKKIPDEEKQVIEKLNIPNSISLKWTEYKDKFYLLSLDRAQTNSKLFSFGSDIFNYESSKWPGLDFEVTYFLRKFKEKEKPEMAMTTKKLWHKVQKDTWWKKSFKRAVKRAKKNSELEEKQDKLKEKFDLQTKLDLDNIRNNETEEDKEEKERLKDVNGDPKQLIRLGSIDQIDTCRFVVRAIATLEMILKDPNSDIVVRRGNKKDFAAALKLIEKIMLPTYFNIIFEKDLFDDYHSVEPIIDLEEV